MTICIKTDLALNNLQRLICHKNQPTNQPISFLAKSWYLSLFSPSSKFTQWSAITAKSAIWQVLFFCWLSLGLVVWLRLDNPFIIIIIIILLIRALTDGFSLGSEWQQVFSSLQDSSQYSGQSRECFRLDGVHLSSNFQVFQFLYKSFGDCTKCTSYNWDHGHLHVR